MPAQLTLESVEEDPITNTNYSFTIVVKGSW
jgi:hypothetical protein